MWNAIQLVGDMNWLAEAIEAGDCIAVTDGSFIREITTEVCSCAFFFENTDRTCKLVGAFPECSETANAYRGELLGLMAIHLILLAVNKVNPDLDGSVIIYSDCERAIGSVEELPSQDSNQIQALGHSKKHPGELLRPELPSRVSTYLSSSRRLSGFQHALACGTTQLCRGCWGQTANHGT